MTQSVRESLADAETLAQFEQPITAIVIGAYYHGRMASYWSCYSASPGGDGQAWHHAVLAARAAFRAVPGLRG